MPDDALPPLRDVIATHNLRAERKFGQNFILDLNLTQRIARAGGDLSECTVIEIGPGPGGLTRGLLMSGARKVIVIEADARFLPALEDIKAAYPDRLEIVQGDALQISPDSLTTEPYRIISNLPYNIATPLFTGWLENSWQGDVWAPRFLSMTCMFQKEVAQRIAAAPGTNNYGRLSVLAGWLTQARILFDVDRQKPNAPSSWKFFVINRRPMSHQALCMWNRAHSDVHFHDGPLAPAGAGHEIECCRKSQPRLSDSDGKCCVPA